MAIIYVLILVLVEHTLRDIHNYESTRTKCLNPCFSGTYSQSCSRDCIVSHNDVLILVLVEHTLRDAVLGSKFGAITVLILVLVEHTLRERKLTCYTIGAILS